MPDSDPSHTASADPRKEELTDLFRGWERDDAGAGVRQRVEAQGLLVRAAITLALAVGAVVILVLTAPSFAFWLEPSLARDLGDLRARHAAGETTALEPGHVLVSGLVPTRAVAVSDRPEPTAPETGTIYFCPLQGIVVFTRDLLDAPSTSAPDPRLADLVRSGVALPEETALSLSAQGRLMPADEAPPALVPFVERYAKRLQRNPGELWVLIDGARPSDVRWAPVVWALAGAAPILSLAFLLRAVYRRRSTGAVA